MEIFSTSDFPIIAFALCKGAQIHGIDKQGPRAHFTLESPISSGELKDLFWRNADVGVRDFVNAQNQIKKRVFYES